MAMKLRAVLVALLCTASPLGCAAFVSALPAVVAVVTDAMQVLDAIAEFVHKYFAAHPDPAREKTVEVALTKCRATLNAALRASQGAKDLDEKKADAAFEQFRAAYQELLALVEPLGVHSQKNGTFAAAPAGDVLAVPEPLAMQKGTSR